MNIDDLVINRVERLMRARGLSQAALAKKAKISKENLNRLLRGHRAITKSDVLLDIASALGVDVEYLKQSEQAENIAISAEAERALVLIRIQDKLKTMTLSELQDISEDIDRMKNPVALEETPESINSLRSMSNNKTKE